MNQKQDSHVEMAKLQKNILNYLGLDSENVIFEYRTIENREKLDLITINPRHNQSFLFHSVEGIDKKDCLNKMLNYLEKHQEEENSYTVQWASKGSNKIHTSYFSAKNMYAALDKLYYGRELNSITVYSIVLNPES